MRYKVLFLDADDTLLDFQKCEYMAIENTFRKYNLPFNEEIFDTYKKHNHGLWAAFERGEIDKPTILAKRFRLTFEELGYTNVPSSFETDYQLALGEGGYLIEGAEKVVSSLSKQCDLYILTNGVGVTQRSRLARSGLMPYIKGLFISEEMGAQKPQKEYFEAVLKALGNVSKEEILMVGDSLGSDIQGGINAGLDTCWYNPHRKKTFDLPLYEIQDIHELINLVLAQEETSNEVWDLYDAKRKLQSQAVRRGANVPQGLYHLVAEVWVICGNQILLTQRHPNKTYGGKYECTGGSVVQGETSLQGAVRELAEEIGLSVQSEELTLVGTTLGVNSLVDTYILKREIPLNDLTLLNTEVVAAKFVDYDKLQQMMEQEQLALPIIKRFKQYQKQWEAIALKK